MKFLVFGLVKKFWNLFIFWVILGDENINLIYLIMSFGKLYVKVKWKIW